MSLSYTWEKLFVAVLGMARSEASLQDRLMGAYLSFHTLRDADFPKDELRTSFQEITHALTSQPAKGNEGTVQATTSLMGDQEAAELIEKIVSLYDEVAQLLGAEDYQRDK
ncbi:hypothetical protein KDH_79950 [Dictyobacter sp. S3.2.2.5]|uniref:Uncharacterized protein n=1 Tax=Dictyobacter halimunensis TaxID=3026934 RepID=A0ABQ6G8L3_9CHLR|nr:hypothetical protein KDH_79950 [Dictyobacter sp. S3.2.2.5]